MAPEGGMPVIVGRSAEVATLRALAERAADGTGAVAVIEGDPGIGKTTVLDALALECDRLGFRVLRGAAEELERQVPFAAISVCLGLRGAAPDSDAAAVAAALRGEEALGRSTAAVSREIAIAEEILDLVERWSTAGPTAILLDDAQWADPASVLVLHRLSQGIEAQPVLLVLATRPTVAEEPVTGLLRALSGRGAHVLRLKPLDEEAVAAMVEALLGAAAGTGLLKLVSGAGGNPLYVSELVSAAFREGAVQITEGVADVSDTLIETGSGWMPRSLVEAVLSQLNFLPPAAREALQIAAVLGQTIDVSLLATVLDTSVVQAWAVVHLAIRVGLVEETGTELGFRHDLIREALAESLPAPVRRAVQRRAGESLAAAGAPPERVAEHLFAGPGIDTSGATWLVQAADTLIVRAPALAVDLFRRAIAAGVGDANALRFHLARALLWAGRLKEAEQAAQDALADGRDPEREGDLRWLLAQACFRLGHIDDVVAGAREAVASPRVSEAQKGRFHGLAALCLLFQHRLPETAAEAAKSVAAGEASGDPVAIGYGHYAHAALRQAQGRPSEALAAVDLARRRFAEGIRPDLQVDPDGLRGHCLIQLDRLTEADAALAAAIRGNLRVDGVYAALNQAARVLVRLLDGRWDDALAEIRTGLEMPDPLGWAAAALRAVQALIEAHRGSFHGSPEQLSGPGRPARFLSYLTAWAVATGHETHGRPGEAIGTLQRYRADSRGMVPAALLTPIYPDLARLADAAGDHKLVQELAALTESLATAEPTASRRGTAGLCRGLAERDPELLGIAAAVFRDASRPLFEAYARENAATVLAKLGRTADARRSLEAAVAIYERLDAAWDVSRAEARLRNAGVRRGVHGSRKRPRQGWDALTETETRVALLVAEGYSNPDIAAQLFISRRTVQTHVSNILAKLNLNSRVELAVVAAAHRERRPGFRRP